MIRLDDQVAIITGSGRGLGAAYARLLAERGTRIVIDETTETELVLSIGRQSSEIESKR